MVSSTATFLFWELGLGEKKREKKHTGLRFFWDPPQQRHGVGALGQTASGNPGPQLVEELQVFQLQRLNRREPPARKSAGKINQRVFFLFPPPPPVFGAPGFGASDRERLMRRQVFCFKSVFSLLVYVYCVVFVTWYTCFAAYLVCLVTLFVAGFGPNPSQVRSVSSSLPGAAKVKAQVQVCNQCIRECIKCVKSARLPMCHAQLPTYLPNQPCGAGSSNRLIRASSRHCMILSH